MTALEMESATQRANVHVRRVILGTIAPRKSVQKHVDMGNVTLKDKSVFVKKVGQETNVRYQPQSVQGSVQ